jgi:microcystin-dependent protein
MTQSFNLSQLANNLTSAGLLDAADGLVNAVPIANGGTGATTASSARTNLDVAQAVYAVPSGGIIMWSGSIASIPAGWLLCNGSSGTPDLRDRFLIGAGSTYGVGGTGGSANATLPSHNHTATSTVTDPQHNHTVQAGFGLANTGNYLQIAPNYAQDFGINNNSTGITVTTSISTEGNSATNANLPPFYALAFIMKT